MRKVHSNFQYKFINEYATVDVDIVTFTLFCIFLNTFISLLNTKYEMIQCEMIQTGGRLHFFGERGILGLFGALVNKPI